MPIAKHAKFMFVAMIALIATVLMLGDLQAQTSGQASDITLFKPRAGGGFIGAGNADTNPYGPPTNPRSSSATSTISTTASCTIAANDLAFNPPQYHCSGVTGVAQYCFGQNDNEFREVISWYLYSYRTSRKPLDADDQNGTCIPRAHYDPVWKQYWFNQDWGRFVTGEDGIRRFTPLELAILSGQSDRSFYGRCRPRLALI